MPHRTSARTVTSTATPQAPPAPQQLETPYDANIRQLRCHWKWAAFSQFFFTFNPLLAMPDVTLADVENDLVHSTNRVLSRIMQRLLVTLTQDRKITTESWQNVLRRQYQRRDPEASPIGLPARSQHFIIESSRASTAPLGTISEVSLNEAEREDESSQQRDQPAAPFVDNPGVCDENSIEDQGHTLVTKVEEEDEVLEPSEKQPHWLDLSMLAKLESLHTLSEWQFQNPNRVRQQMKTDDEQATWRIEPIGYDAKRSAYWLIGGDRLWIQREPPRPNLKRKRNPSGNSRNASKKHLQSMPMKRQRVDPDWEAVAQSPAARPTRGKAKSQLTPSPRGARAAKTRANQKLDAQAKDIAEFKSRTGASRTSTMPRKPAGVRISARLRGVATQDDEWQEVPDEWLTTGDTYQKHAKAALSGGLPVGKKRLKTGLESENSSISELTELSDGEDGSVRTEHDVHERSVVDTSETNAEHGIDEIESQPTEAKLIDPPITPLLPDDFVEWETASIPNILNGTLAYLYKQICVTLEEWESIGQQFEKATHYAERALYKVLTQNIVPMVITELRENEKKRRIEDAVVHRKRSSRIAMKEIEKEEERAAIRKRVEEEEKMSRARRLEARQQREQTERLKRESAREQRRKERESREQQSAETGDTESKFGARVDILRQDTCSNLPPLGHNETPLIPSTVLMNGTGSGSRSPVENWVLDCEICGRKGINQDDGVPLLCCGRCGKWQHIVCHDKQDTVAGRPKRNWDAEDFICRQCHLIGSTSSSSSPTSFLPFGVNNKRGQASNSQAHCVASSDHPKSYPSNEDLSSKERYPCDHSDARAIVPSRSPSTQSYPSQTRSAGVTFAHYQPQQGGFSTSRPTYSVQDVQPPQHARYTITPHTAPTGTTTYPSTAQAITHSPTQVHEQWHPSSYPRISNSYPLNGGSPILAQGAHPYYNGHAHTPYSHIRGTNNQTALGQYTGLRHVPSYQHSK